jgi:1-acyl-sn-glycerol-3-phosphate acyltransferase
MYISILLIILRFLCQIKWKVKGSIVGQNPVVIVSNHQGLWESFYLQTLVSPLTTIIKKELIYVPFFGWALNLLNPIKINRSKKVQSAKKVIVKGSEKLKVG